MRNLRPNRRWLGVATTSAALFLLTIGNSRGADPVLEKIVADWKARQDRMQSVRYHVTGDFILPKGQGRGDNGEPLGADIPPHDVSSPEDWIVLLDFRTNRHRIENRWQGYNAKRNVFSPHEFITAFDGKEVRAADPREANTSANSQPSPNAPDVTITTGNLQKTGLSTDLTPLFLGHGVVFAGGASPLWAGHLKTQPDLDEFSVGGEAVQEGRKCVVLRTEPTHTGNGPLNYEMWVDPERESAVVHYAIVVDGKDSSAFDIDYQQTPQGWLPANWKHVLHDGSKQGGILNMVRMRVAEFTADPPVADADFHIEARPGMRVRVFNYKEGSVMQDEDFMPKEYRVRPDGGWNEIVDGFERQAPGPLAPSPWWWTALIPIGFAAVWLWMSWKRRRSAGAAAR